jgi:hypothetical protein
MRTIEELWQELFPVEQQRITQLLVEGVHLRPDGIEVKMKTEGLHSLIAELQDEETRLLPAFEEAARYAHDH